MIYPNRAKSRFIANSLSLLIYTENIRRGAVVPSSTLTVDCILGADLYVQRASTTNS